MNFYIASGFANKELVMYVSQKLLSLRFSHTYDWTRNDRAVTVQQLQQIGMREKQAVSDCDVFIMLLPAGKGSHVELGMALASDKRIFIYSVEEIDPATASTFYFVDGVERIYGEVDMFIKRVGLV